MYYIYDKEVFIKHLEFMYKEVINDDYFKETIRQTQEQYYKALSYYVEYNILTKMLIGKPEKPNYTKMNEDHNKFRDSFKIKINELKSLECDSVSLSEFELYSYKLK